MPSKEQIDAVGESCSAYDSVDENAKRSCESCEHWRGESKMCALDIFTEQLVNLDQT